MSDNSDAKYRQFDAVLKQALYAFLAYENEHLSTLNVDPAARAARFNNFVMENPEFAVLRKEISPDICERCLKRYHYVTFPTDQGPEPETAKERHKTAINVYSEFRNEANFKGPRWAEAIAFKDYVNGKYPNTLPDFSEAEAQAAIAGSKRKRNYQIGAYLLSLVLAAGLGSALNYAMREPAEPPRKPNAPRTDGKDALPQWKSLDKDPDWHPPVFNPRDPLLPPNLQLPPDPELEAQWRKFLEKQQQDRQKRPGEDPPKGREPGK